MSAGAPEDEGAAAATLEDGAEDGLAEEEIARRAGEAMRKLLAELPSTEPWSGRPAPAFRPLPPP